MLHSIDRRRLILFFAGCIFLRIRNRSPRCWLPRIRRDPGPRVIFKKPPGISCRACRFPCPIWRPCTSRTFRTTPTPKSSRMIFRSGIFYGRWMITTPDRGKIFLIPSRATPECGTLKNLNSEVFEIRHDQLILRDGQPTHFAELSRPLAGTV